MIALLLAAAIGQVEDVAELRERYELAAYTYQEELAAFNRSIRERRARIQIERNQDRRRELSRELDEYKRDVSELLFGIRQAVDKMRSNYLKANPARDATSRVANRSQSIPLAQ